MIRKLTNHYLDDFCAFVNEVRNTRLNSLPHQSTSHLFRTQTQNQVSYECTSEHLEILMGYGAFFFATDTAVDYAHEKITHENFLIAGYVRIRANDEMEKQPALQDEFEAEIVEVWYRPNLAIQDSQFPRDFFRVMERYAGSHGFRRIKFSVTHFSLLIGYLANDGWLIESHGLRKSQSLEIDFVKDLLPDFSGDPKSWVHFCEWYLDLSFGPIMRRKDEPELRDGGNICIFQFDVAADQQIHPIPTASIPVVAVTVASQCSEKAIEDTCAFLATKNSHRLILCEDKVISTKVKENAGSLKQLSAVSYVEERKELFKSLEMVKRYYFGITPEKGLESTSDDLWSLYCLAKFEWDPLTMEQKGLLRGGAIVEIDMDTYLELVFTRVKRDDKQELVFFNEPTFGEKLLPGDTLFFFVWDSLHNRGVYTGAKTVAVPGIICAYAEIKKVERRSVQFFEDNWAEYKWKAIWDDKKFLRRYFSGKIVAFTLVNVVYHPVSDAAARKKVLRGIVYDDLVKDILLQIQVHGSEEVERIKMDAAKIFPIWEVGNSYVPLEYSEILCQQLDQLPGRFALIENRRSEASQEANRLLFIVYSGGRGAEFARDVKDYIERREQSVEVVLDQEMQASTNYQHFLPDTARRCDAVLALITPELFECEWYREHEHPIISRRITRKNVFFIPIILETTLRQHYTDFYGAETIFKVVSNEKDYLPAFQHEDFKEDNEKVIESYVKTVFSLLEG